MISETADLTEFYKWYQDEVAEGGDTAEKFVFFLRRQLMGIELSGKRVLEVGCGKGAFSLFLAMFSDAKQIVALDEAAGEGSPVGVTESLKKAIIAFGLTNIAVDELDIMSNKYRNGNFDIIISNNALHHVVASGLLSRDQKARQGYSEMFCELKRLLVSSGILAICEYSRMSIWRWLPYKSKWKQVDWDLHPTLNEWLRVMKDAGFGILRCEYNAPYAFRKLPILFSNALAQFFIYPRFFITARK